MASFSPDDINWISSSLKQGNFSQLEIDIVSAAFDHQTDFDEKAILENIKRKKLFKKICLYEILLFPITIFFSFLIFGLQEAKERWQFNKLYIQYFFNKLSIEKAQKKLALITKDSIVI